MLGAAISNCSVSLGLEKTREFCGLSCDHAEQLGEAENIYSTPYPHAYTRHEVLWQHPCTYLLPLRACRSLAEPLPEPADVRAANFAALDPTAEGGLVSYVGVVYAIVNPVGDGRPDVGLQSRDERGGVVVTGAGRCRRVESPRDQRAKSRHGGWAFVQRPALFSFGLVWFGLNGDIIMDVIRRVRIYVDGWFCLELTCDRVPTSLRGPQV